MPDKLSLSRALSTVETIFDRRERLVNLYSMSRTEREHDRDDDYLDDMEEIYAQGTTKRAKEQSRSIDLLTWQDHMRAVEGKGK